LKTNGIFRIVIYSIGVTVIVGFSKSIFHPWISVLPLCLPLLRNFFLFLRSHHQRHNNDY
jgi:hypothetical protein